MSHATVWHTIIGAVEDEIRAQGSVKTKLLATGVIRQLHLVEVH